MEQLLTKTMEMVKHINKLQHEICHECYGVVLRVTFEEDGQTVWSNGDYDSLKQWMIETWGENLASRALTEAEKSMVHGRCKVYFDFPGYPEKVSFVFQVKPWASIRDI